LLRIGLQKIKDTRLPQLQADRIIALHGANVSVILECVENGAPLWRYWGPRLSGDFAPGPPLLETRPTPSFSLDATVALSIFPTFGLGWFGQSALLAHRDGLDFSQDFSACAIEWIVPGVAVRLVCEDSNAGICVMATLRLENDVLTVSHRLTNTGSTALDVQWLAAAALPLPDTATRVESFSGRHNNEFVPQSEPLGRAIWRKENRHGLTSHEAFPGALVMAGPVTFGAQIAWSGNHVQSIEWLDDGRYQWQFGEWLAPGEIRLEPGDMLQSPDVLATCSSAGANGVAHNFHGAIRQRLCWPDGSMKPRPVHLNTWEGYYFDHDLLSLIGLADAAADVGIERFVLDDGWFHRRDNDTKALGDWTTDRVKYPGGLAPLADHVIGKGMAFGLWVEPEMVNPDSDLFRKHPDWALQTHGRPLLTARNQLVLDLSRVGVADYLYDCIAKLLNDLPISYLKWDHNRDLVTAGNRASYHCQVHAAYALFDRFRQNFPHVEIEACAGGGGRIDAGIVQHTHRFWTSDCIDAVSRARMQPGFLQFMPPELMGAHIGTAPAHSTGRSQSLDFRAAIACQGHLGVEFDLVKLPPDERVKLASWIDFYKSWRHILHQTVWTGTANDGLVWHAAGTNDEWLLFVYRIEPTTYRHAPVVRMPFVRRGGHYTVARVSPNGSDQAIGHDGSWLIEAGLSIPPLQAETAVIFHIKQQN
jgi:alpha-galactosidase